MSSYIDFEYGKMWKHYMDRVGHPTDDVYVRVYSTEYVAMKYNSDNNEIKPFKHAGMHAWKIDKSDPIYKHKIFEHGAFVLGDKKENRKKNLFIVALEKIKNFFVANHFSFMLNKGSSAKTRQRPPLHFHWTNYVPYYSHPTGMLGNVVHIQSHLPDKFDIPLTLKEFTSSGMLSKGLDGLAFPVFDILTRPRVHPTETRTPSQTLIQNSKVSSMQVGNGRRRYRHYKFMTMNFCNMFRILPIHKIFVFAVKHEGVEQGVDNFDVTIIVRDRLHHVHNHGDFAFVLKLTRDELYNDDRLETEIARCMHNKSWQDFVDPLYS